jgi:hypothetical protein
MTEQQPDHTEDHDHAGRGGLDPAPVTPTEEKTEPESGTGSADKRSSESQAEQDEPPTEGGNAPGVAGGDQTL